MSRGLFAERFAATARTQGASPSAPGRYEEELGYSVTWGGAPLVEFGLADGTTTMTFVEAESPDNDRAWDQAIASVDTGTRARTDRDNWGS